MIPVEPELYRTRIVSLIPAEHVSGTLQNTLKNRWALRIFIFFTVDIFYVLMFHAKTKNQTSMFLCLHGNYQSMASEQASNSHMTPEELLRLAGSWRSRGLLSSFPRILCCVALLPLEGSFYCFIVKGGASFLTVTSLWRCFIIAEMSSCSMQHHGTFLLDSARQQHVLPLPPAPPVPHHYYGDTVDHASWC